MAKVMHMQQTLPASVSEVFNALTNNDALQQWFAEHTAVSIEDGRYDFWGQYTPETPNDAEGRHELQIAQTGSRLRFTWLLRGTDTTVDIRLTERNDKTILGLWHYDIPSIPQAEPDCYSMGDVWCLWLDNLRRYLEGRPVTRLDFSTSRMGNLSTTIEIDGSAADVWGVLTDPSQRNRWITNDANEEPSVGASWVDWGEHGGLEVLKIVAEKELSLGWKIGGEDTVVTWTLEESGSQTRLTLSHSGFAPNRHSDGEWGGWMSFLAWIKSMVEMGSDWLPPVTELTKKTLLFYSAVIVAQQDTLLGDSDDEWR
ncbi:MAG: SRPBCC domain-containing protein [Gemmatimonadetes bacterium]|nr:SRPBCC domain-containing protein [Gemmatimonadota bacterium]